MVALVVEDEDVADAFQFGHDAVDHAAFGFGGVELGSVSLEERASAFGDVDGLALLEGVEVGDDDFGFLEVGEHVGGDEFAALVVAVGVVGLEDAEAVFDGDAGGDDEEAAGEAVAAGASDGVDRLPGDEHGHDGGFAGAGGELEGEAEQFGVGLGVGFLDALDVARAAAAGRDFGEPDHRFDGFDLAEEWAHAAEVVAPPVAQEAGGFRRDAPVALVGECAPALDFAADVGDVGGDVLVLLVGGGEAL